MFKIIYKLKTFFNAFKEIESLKLELSEAKEDLNLAKFECNTYEQGMLDANDYSYVLSHENGVLEAQRNGLKALVTKLIAAGSSNIVSYEEMYNALCSELDFEGWKLFRAAEEILGKFSYANFAYEDNRGVFDREDCDGNEMLGWLEGGRFGAYEYDIVPGTSYESSHYVGHDENAPEYVAYRKELFATVIKNMLEIELPESVAVIIR